MWSYLAAQTLIAVLKQSGDNVTRENVTKQAASLKNLELDMLLPDIRVNIGPNDFAPVNHCWHCRPNLRYNWRCHGHEQPNHGCGIFRFP
jgi:hypothetical protein